MDDDIWRHTYRLPDGDLPTGSYQVQAIATDIAGNAQAPETVQTVTLNIDNTAPIATLETIGSFANTIVNSNTISVITDSVQLEGIVTDTGRVGVGVDTLEWALVPIDAGRTTGKHPQQDTARTSLHGALPYALEDVSGRELHSLCTGSTCPQPLADGRVGAAMTFDGVDDFLLIDDTNALRFSDTNPVSFTLSAWLNPNANTTGIIINREGEYEIARFPNGNLHWALAIAAPRWRWIDTGVPLPLNQWSHIAFTYDSSLPEAQAVRTYLNGELAATQSGRGVLGDVSILQNEVQIGNRQGFNTPFAGALDEVSIFNAALSADDIAALVADSDRTWSAATLEQPGAVSTAWSGTIPADIEGFFQIDLRGTDGLGNRNEEHRTWAQWRGEIDTRAPQAELIGTLEVFNEAILNLPFEGTTATVFSDTAGLSLNPSCMSDRCPTLDTTSPVSDGLRFDGNDYLLIPNDPALNIQGTMTLAAWVRPQATDSIRNIIARGYMLTPNGEVFLRIANGQYQIGSWNGTDHFASSAAGVATADIGQWVHLVGTYDGTTWRLYRNGVAIATQAALTGAVPVNSPWAIGARFTGSERHFVGGIDEAGIFNRAWSANEVQTFYTNMLNGTGDTFPQDGALFYLDANKTPAPAYMDVSAAMNNAACGTAAQCPTPVPGSPSGQALSFDGVDDTLTVPGINVADQSFSIGFWARRTRLNVNDFIIAQGTAGSTRQGLHIGFRSNNTFTCALWGDDVNSPSVPDTNWHHWLCTYDTATRALTLYRDGVAVATRTTAGNYTGSGDLLIGRYLAGITGFNFQGRLDQINVFGRASPLRRRRRSTSQPAASASRRTAARPPNGTASRSTATTRRRHSSSA
ncbi:MAG: LamG domain-containing protein [Chloroflexaceae bacterium]|nr:LamG domain-containing protein [Chloroflexaceae bacterium]